MGITVSEKEACAAACGEVAPQRGRALDIVDHRVAAGDLALAIKKGWLMLDMDDAMRLKTSFCSRKKHTYRAIIIFFDWHHT